MIGVLAAALPIAVPVVSAAAELGQVDVSDRLGNTQLTLETGSTVTYAGTGVALKVSTAGNRVAADDIRVTAGGVGTTRAIGVMAELGGTVELSNGSVDNVGTQQQSHALYATGAGSAISGSGLQVSTAGPNSHGAYAQSGGKITLDGGSVSIAGNVSHGLYAEGSGSQISATSLDILATGVNSAAAGAYNGARVQLVDVNADATNGTGISADGAGSFVDLTNTTVTARAGTGIYVRNGTLLMQGGSVASSGDAIMLTTASGAGAGGAATIRNASLRAANGYGVNINAQRSSAVLDNVSIFALGSRGTGVWLPSIDTSLVARNVDIDAWMVGIDNRAGRVTLQDGSVQTHGDNAHALYVSREYGATASITATGTRISTSGAGAAGALARASGASIRLTNVTVDTQGASAYGLYASGNGSELIATDTRVTTRGADASGLVMSNLASVALDGSRLSTSGENAHGIWSYVTAENFANNLLLTNGALVDTQDGVGLIVSGGDHNLTLRDTSITARKAGDASTGLLLQSVALNVTSGGVTTAVQTGQVNLDAARSDLAGDVVANSGAINIALSDNSTLTGALLPRSGRIDSLSLDGTSVWNIRASSALGTLSNAGAVAFAPPTGASAFKTLTVRDYAGGGTLVMNTRLGGDDSPTDKLVIDGGTTSGVTGMRILNTDGAGAQTQEGIKLVETINGGTTTPDAFRLDEGSTGFRSSTGTLALNGYDYSLVRGGNQGVPYDWYLTSLYTPVAPVQPVDPDIPGTVPTPDPAPPTMPPDSENAVKPPVIVPPDSAQFVNVSPESGAYLGNQLAAARMFMHGLHDRDVTYVSSSNEANSKPRDKVWVRAQGAHLDGLRLAQGDVDIDTDISVVQIGGDLLHAPLGNEGLVVAGVMAGYGDARARSTSRLMLPGADRAVDATARGKVQGYSAGAYATAYANGDTRMGAYADTWVQYGRYSNQIRSELGAANYRSHSWTVSVETGYAFSPFAPESALGSMVVIPQAQVAYTRLSTKDAALPGVTYKGGNDGQVNTRAGVRIYPLGMPLATATVRPFLEANWLHATGNPTADTGAEKIGAEPSRNAGELKLGAEGRLGKSTYLTGYVVGQSGSGDRHGYGGMLNLSYRW